MARRALLTDAEKEHLTQPPENRNQSYYNTRSRVRDRLERLVDDLEHVKEHFPEAEAEFVAVRDAVQDVGDGGDEDRGDGSGCSDGDSEQGRGADKDVTGVDV